MNEYGIEEIAMEQAKNIVENYLEQKSKLEKNFKNLEIIITKLESQFNVTSNNEKQQILKQISNLKNEAKIIQVKLNNLNKEESKDEKKAENITELR